LIGDLRQDALHMIRLGIIGCGLRADRYMCQLASGLGSEWHVVALADPQQLAIDIYQEHYAGGQAKAFASGPELLDAMRGKLDAVIIAPPGALHAESAIPAIQQDLTILLEKPVATEAADCATMWQCYVDRDEPALAVGFVLRYTSFYRSVKQIIDSGRIGQVLTITATELMCPMLTQYYGRTWRMYDRFAGSFILEKCCHDMDILGWLADAPAAMVSSFGTRTRFVPNPNLPTHCKDCDVRDTCRYDAEYMDKRIRNEADDEWLNRVGRLLASGNDLCVFNSDKDVPDHQVVTIQYANGVLASFTAAMDQDKTNRTLRIQGTKGEIEGDIGKDELFVRTWDDDAASGHVAEQITLEHDGSGHHGADSVIGEQFKAMLRGEQIPPAAGLREGIEGCLVAFAAEKSRHEQCIVNMDTMRQGVLM
jgi:predicted dehydrogenase